MCGTRVPDYNMSPVMVMTIRSWKNYRRITAFKAPNQHHAATHCIHQSVMPRQKLSQNTNSSGFQYGHSNQVQAVKKSSRTLQTSIHRHSYTEGQQITPSYLRNKYT